MDLLKRRVARVPPSDASSSAAPLYRLVGIWFLLTLLTSLALLGVQQLAQIDTEYIRIVQFAPTIALLMIMVTARVRTSAVSPPTVRAPIFFRRALLAIAVIGTYVGMIIAGVALVGAERHDPAFGSVGLLLLFLVLQFAGSCGEEFGWRGFLQPALETRMPRLLACFVTGILWALWHVQVFADPLAGALFTVSCVALSILYGYLVIGNAWQRGVVAGFLHASVNVTMFLAIDPEQTWAEYVPLPVVFVGLCVLVLALVRRTPGSRRLATVTGGTE